MKPCSDALKSISILTGLSRISLKNFSCSDFVLSEILDVVNFPALEAKGLPRIAESKSGIAESSFRTADCS